MNKRLKRLLAILAQKGRKIDEPTKENVKAALEALDLEVDDFDAMFEPEKVEKTKAKLIVDDGEDTETKGKLANAEAEIARLKARGRDIANQPKLVDDDSETDPETKIVAGRLHKARAENWARKSARAAYNARVKSANPDDKRSSPVWVDADQAEIALAQSRLSIAEMIPQVNTVYSSKLKAYDEDVLKGARLKIQSEISDTAGGALVPVEFVDQLIYMTENVGCARQCCEVVPMSSNEKKYPRQTSIQTMAFILETGTVGASDAGYDLVNLHAKKAGYLTRFSTELFEDSSLNLSDRFYRNAAEAQMRTEDGCFIAGDGSATYGGMRGLANSSGVGLPSGSYFAVSASAWSAMTAGDLWVGPGSVRNVNWANCKYLMSRQAFFQVAMRLAATQAKTAAGDKFIAASINDDRLGGQINGFPVVFDNSGSMLRASSNASPTYYFGDFAGAVKLGDRRTLKIESSRDAYFTTDEIAFRVTARFTVNVHGDGTSGTVGPIVGVSIT